MGYLDQEEQLLLSYLALPKSNSQSLWKMVAKGEDKLVFGAFISAHFQG